MEANNYQTIKFQPLSRKEKQSLIVLFFFLVILFALYFIKSNEFKSGTNDESSSVNKIRCSETQIEMICAQNSNIMTVGVFTEKINKLQVVLEANNMVVSANGIKKAYSLFIGDFKTEALFEYATTIDFVLKNRLKPYIYVDKPLSFFTTINIAFERGIINIQDKEFLHNLRKLRNRKAHIPGIDFNTDIAETYMENGINLLETIIT